MSQATVAGPLKATVVIPAFNRAALIRETLDSVRGPAGAIAAEIVVVDDGSTDNTAALVEAYGPPVRLLRKPNGGPGSARNVGVQAALAPVVVFLDSDDLALPGCLEAIVGYMHQNPQVLAAFGNSSRQGSPGLDYLDTMGLPSGHQDFQVLGNALGLLLARGCFITNSMSAVRRQAFLDVGMQRTDIRVAEDYDLWMRFASVGPIAYTGKPLSWGRERGQDRLMRSGHTYRGPVVALRDNLVRFGAQVSPQDRAAALRRLRGSAGVLLRHHWAYHGGAAVREVVRELAPWLPAPTRAAWLLLSLVPGAPARWYREKVRSRRAGNGDA